MLEETIAVPASPDAEMTRPRKDATDLAGQVLDALEQGVIMWSKAGVCLTCNESLYQVLELHPTQVQAGTSIADFQAIGAARGDEMMPSRDDLNALRRSGGAFRFDQTLASGRIVSCNVRPVRDGGYIEAYSDVTEARQAVSALEQARAAAKEAQREAAAILNDERARQREASRLARLDEWLQSCKSLDELYQIVTSFMQMVMPSTRGQLYIYSNSRDVLEMACAWNSEVTQEQVTPDSCWALRRGRTYFYEPHDLCFVCDHVAYENGEGGASAEYLCVPIIAHGDTVGMLHLTFCDAIENPDVMDPVKFSSRCGEHISMAIANVKLRDELQDQSTRDPLTGLYNRRYFSNAIRREMANAAHRENSFAILAVDADKFKNFNDEHGHDAGDQVLEMIAEKMRTFEADGIVACRIGGEEFTIILPNADRTRASAAAEDLRQSIAEARVKHMGGALPKVTVSIGIAIYPTHGTVAKDLIKQADMALYAAKKTGRNCWKIAEGDGMISFE